MASTNEITMPKEIIGQDIEHLVASDLSAGQYLYVKKDASNYLVLAGAGDQSIGILQNAPKGATGAPVVGVVRSIGYSKLYTAGDITQDQFIKSDANGKGVAATANKDKYGSKAVQNSSNGDLTVVLLGGGTLSA